MNIDSENADPICILNNIFVYRALCFRVEADISWYLHTEQVFLNTAEPDFASKILFVKKLFNPRAYAKLTCKASITFLNHVWSQLN